MSQECMPSNPNLEHLGGQAHILLPTLPTGRPNLLLPTEETSMSAPMSIRYWRLLNDPGFSSPIANPTPPIISVEAFLDLTHQVQAQVGMMQTIVSHIPQLMQMLASQQPGAPQQAPQRVPQPP
ncbi:hypothetical protein B296_00010018 [Ensete ventricosum]|uniref:Uncharacterized protein n=1 Tax=Ensete ventricosum TaxID=4639 RepID=A0A427B277_ENSVE|nr:hypothetical protein B296_00010018 [Ensete ventricosum]